MSEVVSLESQTTAVVPFISYFCGDWKLHAFANALDNLSPCHRERRLGGGFIFRINQTALLEFDAIVNGFSTARFEHTIIFTHTGCLALRDCNYFAGLRQKREAQFSPDHAGEIAFNSAVLKKIRFQTQQLRSPIIWHFGIVETEKVIDIRPDSSLDEVLSAVIWPFGPPPPEVLQGKIRHERLGPMNQSTPGRYQPVTDCGHDNALTA